MSGIGPELPPHLLAKRKRQREDEVSAEQTAASGANRSASPDATDKKRRTMGPVMPPAPLNEMPQRPPNGHVEDSSDDDDFGPALPSAETDDDTTGEPHPPSNSIGEDDAASKPQRDAWMMMAPEQDDLAARMDPTKQRPRGFNTGKGAKSGNAASTDRSAWHEMAAQKQKRLADEMMGVAKPDAPGPGRGVKAAGASKDTSRNGSEAAIGKVRGPSLLEQHRQTTGAEAEDDPSKRVFDREKDMGGGGHVSSSQRREMLNKAADFSSRFSGGGLL